MSSKREGRRASLESRLPHDLLKGRLPRRDSRDRVILSLEDGDGAAGAGARRADRSRSIGAEG